MADEEFDGLTFDDAEGTAEEAVELADVLDRVMERIPPPVINVFVEQKPMKTVPVRDENGVISYTVQEPFDGSEA